MLKKSKIPPLGAIPRAIFERDKMDERIIELREAIKRFVDSNYPLPYKLVEEYNALTKDLPTEEKDEVEQLADL